MSNDLAERVRFIGGANDNIYVYLIINILGDAMEVTEARYDDITMDSLLGSFPPQPKMKRGWYRRGDVVDGSVIYMWDGWYYDE